MRPDPRCFISSGRSGQPRNLNDYTLFGSCFELAVFKPDSFVCVVESQAFGNGVSEWLEGSDIAIVIKFAAAAGEEANDDCHASLALLPLLDAFVQWS